jgi:ABC-type nitrate/sulfonate/bicarbonate transport system permease component
LAGLLSTDPALRDLFKLYGASRLATLWKLRLPSALPNIITGLRIAAGLAVIGAIVGELVAGVLTTNLALNRRTRSDTNRRERCASRPSR